MLCIFGARIVQAVKLFQQGYDQLVNFTQLIHGLFLIR